MGVKGSFDLIDYFSSFRTAHQVQTDHGLKLNFDAQIHTIKAAVFYLNFN